MSVGYIVAAIRCRVRWALGAFLIVVSVAILLFLVTPYTYSSRTTFYVSAQLAGADATQSAYQGGLLSAQKVKSYIELISSPSVSNQISDSLGGNPTSAQIEKEISASANPDSVVIVAEVTDGWALRASEIASRLLGSTKYFPD